MNIYIIKASKEYYSLFVDGYMLRLPVFTSLEDAEAMKKEMEIKRILIELKE